MKPVSLDSLLKTLLCRLLKKISDARRAKSEELRRTLQYGKARRAQRNEAYEAFSAAC